MPDFNVIPAKERKPTYILLGANDEILFSVCGDSLI